MAAGLLKNINDREKLHTQPFRFMNSKGEWRWVKTTASSHLHNPAINGLIVNSRDITDKKHYDDKMKASEQRFKALVQNGSDLIVVLDEKAHFTYISDNVINLLGYTPEEMQQRNAFDFIHTHAGFDTQAYKPCIGITNMKTMTEALNANFKIKSAPGKGCRIQVSFPLN